MTEAEAKEYAQVGADRDGKPWNVFRLIESPHVYVARGPWARTPSPERYQFMEIVKPTPGSTPVVSHGFGCGCCPELRR